MIPNRAAATPDERNRVPHRVSTTWWTLGLPAVVLAVCGTLALAWRSELPEPLAAHWGPQGVDGTSSFVGLVLPVIGATGLLSVGMWAVGFFLGRPAMTRRLANAMAAWFAVFLAGVLLGVLAGQRGVADAAHAGDIDRALTLGAALATASAVAIALLTPDDAPHSTAAPIPADAPTVPLANSEQITWVRAVGQRSGPGIALAVLTFSAVLGATTRQWPLAIVLALVLGPMLIAELRWTVTVDRNGLTARSGLRWPTLHVPLDEVQGAEVVTVRPLREFGGFGLRIGLDGRTGAVLRKGPALQVHRTGGRVVVVTVDDAETGAAVLNTLASRAR